jgi:hypothetical protein
MSLSSEQASQALRDVEAISHRSGQLYRYQRFAPMFVLWGVIWLVGFALTHFYPASAAGIWIPLDVIGIGGCIFLGRRGKQDASNSTSWRWLASTLAVVVFYIAVLNVFQPSSGEQSAVLISLIVALFYFIGGLWIGSRLAVSGVALAVLTLVGYYVFPAYFLIWMAAVGGGSLILAGVWLRTA